jgi:hypothetical protein
MATSAKMIGARKAARRPHLASCSTITVGPLCSCRYCSGGIEAGIRTILRRGGLCPEGRIRPGSPAFASKASVGKRIDGSRDRSIQGDNRDEQKERWRETKERNGCLPETQRHVPLPLLLAAPSYGPSRQERRGRTYRLPIHGVHKH